MYRAKALRDELVRELLSYYGTNPGYLFEIPESTEANRKFVFKEKELIPARLALICGDVLQCLRSSLDYLVWELSNTVDDKTRKRLMFPICVTEATYEEELTKRKRLDGVPLEAVAIIDRHQPYKDILPEETTLAMLDSLTNINKHRRVILTGFAGLRTEVIPAGIPHIIGEVTMFGHNGEVASQTPVHAVLTIQDGFAKDIEITNFIDVTAQFLREEFFPLFQRFFK